MCFFPGMPISMSYITSALRSDAYVMTDDYRIVPNPERKVGALTVSLDSAYYKMLADFEARFPRGTPCLVDCVRLEVQGDFFFGGDVVLKGEVRLINESEKQIKIADGSVLEGTHKF